jgi:hypothetical protein
MKTNLENWAFTFLTFGIVLPLIMGALAFFHRTDIDLNKARVEGCEYAKRQGDFKYNFNCKELIK